MHKKEKYVNLVKDMSRNYRCVKFVNLSMSSVGVFSNECFTFLEMMNDIGVDKNQQKIIKKMVNLAMRATYFIFCRRNKNWDSPVSIIIIIVIIIKKLNLVKTLPILQVSNFNIQPICSKMKLASAMVFLKNKSYKLVMRSCWACPCS